MRKTTIVLCVLLILILPDPTRAWLKTDVSGYVGETIGYSWIDARAGYRLSLSGDDEISVYGFLPFKLRFYGEQYLYVIISTNGLVGFDVVGADFRNNSPLPYASPPNNIICPFWDDLTVEPSKGGAIYVYHDTTVDAFVIQWDHVTDALTETNSLTFQVQFFNSPPEIRFMYQSLKGSIASGNSATVGIENQDGTIGIRSEDIYDAGHLYDGLGISFSPKFAIPDMRPVALLLLSVLFGFVLVSYLIFFTSH
jgi:hypothetical protein